MLGYLSVNGTLTFKKSYDDSDYYDFNYFAQHTRIKQGNDKLKSKKGKGSRQYTINYRSRRKIENATLLMRHYQKSETHTIKFLTLTFAKKHKKPNRAVSRFFNRLMKDKIIQNYWWVKEYHPKHYEQTGQKKEHYHCLVCMLKYMTKNKILNLWQLQAGIDTVIIDLQNIRVRNKYNSFSYQIVMYVAKYCSKGIDKFSDRVYGMSEQLSKQSNIPIIYAKTIKNLLQNISKNANKTENDIIYYREHWNQAYLKVNTVKTYLKIKNDMENDSLWRWLYLDAQKFECENTKQEEKFSPGQKTTRDQVKKLHQVLEINFKNFNLKPV